MKKLKLNLDEIKVESFETKIEKSNFGTVIGQGGDVVPNLPEPAPTAIGCQGSNYVTCETCSPMYCYWSEFASCGSTCDVTICSIGC